MKILYLLFAFLFLAFLSEPGNAYKRCHKKGGHCFPKEKICIPPSSDFGKMDCRWKWKCCKKGSVNNAISI
uniref:Crotamine 1 n=1 Tax=Crotalus helleri TaxID=8741 RepID=G9DCI3_CROHE|nr:crotamine 1 [Crotalus oreganus helleri]